MLFDGVHNPHFATQLFIQKLGKKSQRTATQPVRNFYLLGFSAQVICPTIRGLFSEREIENKFGEAVLSWQLQFIGYAASNIHT